MKGLQIKVDGNWGHFKKPETNNNPLSHDLITKTALIGLIGAVLGIERKVMKEMFPKLSEDILYGVQLLSPVKKISWGFTSKTAINPTGEGSPKYFEFLKNPQFKVSIALQDDRSKSEFLNFQGAVRNGESIYTPVLGWHNCPANITFDSEGDFIEKAKEVFDTKGFVLAEEHTPKVLNGSFRIGFDKLPTYQDNDFWNRPEKYKRVIYPDFPHSILVEGKYFEYKGKSCNNEDIVEKWFLM